MRKIVTVVLIIVLYSCSNKQDVTGLYVSKNNLNTIDSVWINSDGTYINLMYRKKDNTLVYRNTGNWSFSNGYITFDKFFADEDEEHSTEFTKFEEVLMTTKLPIESKDGKAIIHHKSMYDNIYLEKTSK